MANKRTQIKSLPKQSPRVQAAKNRNRAGSMIALTPAELKRRKTFGYRGTMGR